MEPELTHTLYHNDLSALALGSLSFQDGVASQHLLSQGQLLPGGLEIPSLDPAWQSEVPPFKVIERGTGKYIEASAQPLFQERRLIVAGDSAWSDIKLRAVMTPLDTDGSDAVQGLCGIVVRFVDPQNYIALAIDRDRQIKLIQRICGEDILLDAQPLDFCLGQSLTLCLIVIGEQLHGTAGPYTGTTHVRGKAQSATQCGRVGYLTGMAARMGPFTVECSVEEAARLEQEKIQQKKKQAMIQAQFPQMRLDKSIPLHSLVNGRNIRIADINQDGKPEIILAQGSPDLARKLSLTRLTCLTVLNLEGEILWQAGVPDPSAPLIAGDLPFQVHDLYGDGGKVVVCVFGYDLQVRDGRTGKVLFSAETPHRNWVGDEYKNIADPFGAKWGDETLNMDVASLGFCSTLGSNSREIFVQDDFHRIAVLDALSNPPLQVLFQHRGNHGRFPWVGDINGDGKEELLAGYSLLGENGRVLATLPLKDFSHAGAVMDPLHPELYASASTEAEDQGHLKVLIAGGSEGFIFADLSALLEKTKRAEQASQAGRAGCFVSPVGSGFNAVRLSLAKFRADLPGVQIAVAGGWQDAGQLSLYDACGRKLWSKQLATHGVLAQAVNWTGLSEELILSSLPHGQGFGLFNGHGDCVVKMPPAACAEKYACCDTSSEFSTDGRDAILAWNSQKLDVYLPDDPVGGVAALKKKTVYQPRRSGAENSSNYRAHISLPPL